MVQTSFRAATDETRQLRRQFRRFHLVVVVASLSTFFAVVALELRVLVRRSKRVEEGRDFEELRLGLQISVERKEDERKKREKKGKKGRRR